MSVVGLLLVLELGLVSEERRQAEHCASKAGRNLPSPS